MPEFVLVSVLTCPRCGFAKTETMPTDACLFFYDCESCGARLKPSFTPFRFCYEERLSVFLITVVAGPLAPPTHPGGAVRPYRPPAPPLGNALR